MADFEERIARLATDRESGASEILDEALEILRDALTTEADVRAIARAVCRAQPSMAPIWNASIAAVASVKDPERFNTFTQRVARAPGAVTRFTLECFEGSGPLRVVTISFSRTVVSALEALNTTRPLRVICSESRPALEGRRLASRMAEAGIPVMCFSDAAIGHALGAVDAVLVGADAVAPEWFLNKSGTRMLAAGALQQGIPVYVLASRDKFVSHAVAGRLIVADHNPAEVWSDPPAGVIVRNPYFESTPLDLVASVITDAGILGAGMVPDVCEAIARDTPSGVLKAL